MKLFLCLIILACITKSQNYKISCFGIHIGDVSQKILNNGKIEYEMKSRGFADMIWPTNNSYYTVFDTETFALKSWGKNIEQGMNKVSLSADIDSIDNILHYEKKSIQLKNPIFTIFTVLAMIQNRPYEKIDTKWFPFEHQGKLGKTRLLWSDSLMLWSGKDSVMCDHYRMDINISDSTLSLDSQEDYFMDNIHNEDYIREFWVKRDKEKEIIQVSFKNAWLTLIAKKDH